MLNDLISAITYKISPSLNSNWKNFHNLRQESIQLRKHLDDAKSMKEKVTCIFSSKYFAPLQKVGELEELLKHISPPEPVRVCEIGGANGGTLAAFCEVASSDATLISIDIAYTVARCSAHKKLARKGQRVYCLTEDSHSSDTPVLLKRLLGGQLLDVLLIDGDHSYEGVKLDYEMYSPFVRPGGVIAFHDIVPDSLMKTGKPSSAYVGGVPVFWNELVGQGLETREIIENKSQDGYGIGLVRKI